MSRILVVDDEEAVGRLLEGWLSSEGYQVRYARDFDEVQQFIQEECFDLATLDIMMPGVDGLQVLRWFKQHHPDLGVVMATAMGDLDTVLEAMRGGASNYLLKPFNLELVSEQIHRAMERQHLIAENHSYQQHLEQKVEEQTRELQQAYARLEQQVRELEGRDRLVRCQMSGPRPGEASAQILQVVEQVLQVGRAVLYQPRVNGEQLKAAAALGLSRPGWLADGGELEALPILQTGEGDALAVQTFQQQQPNYGREGEAAVPLLYQEEVLGVLWVDGLEETEEGGNALWRLGQEAALVLWSAQVTADLESGQLQVDELLELDEESS